MRSGQFHRVVTRKVSSVALSGPEVVAQQPQCDVRPLSIPATTFTSSGVYSLIVSEVTNHLGNSSSTSHI